MLLLSKQARKGINLILSVIALSVTSKFGFLFVIRSNFAFGLKVISSLNKARAVIKSSPVNFLILSLFNLSSSLVSFKTATLALIKGINSGVAPPFLSCLSKTSALQEVNSFPRIHSTNSNNLLLPFIPLPQRIYKLRSLVSLVKIYPKNLIIQSV